MAVDLVRARNAYLVVRLRRLGLWLIDLSDEGPRYFEMMRHRPDRATIRLEWIQWVIDNPKREVVRLDGRIRRWAAIAEAEGRYLRVVLLPDGETVHNAFFDRSFVP